MSMKPGHTRKVDGFGRVVIPMEIRKMLNIYEGSLVSLRTGDNGTIVIYQVRPTCIICGETDPDKLVGVNAKFICCKCLGRANNAIE